MQFPFGPYAPDRGDNTPGALMVADGCVPLDEGYGPFPAAVAASTATAMAGAPRGMFPYQKADSSWALAGGSGAKVQLMASDYTWTDIDTGLAPPSGYDFIFERYGTKLAYTNTVDGLRVYDVESAGAASAVSAAGAPEYIFECGNILFGLNCLDTAAARDNKLIRSCKRGDLTKWTGTGTDYQPLTGGGALIAGKKLSENTALILQARKGRVLQVGNVGNKQWALSDAFDEFGAVGAKSVVGFNGAVYWLATDGFKRFTAGGGLEHIGAGLIDQTFLADLDQSDMSLVQGAIDPFRKCVLWRYKDIATGSSTVFEKIIGYYWPKGRWFTLPVQSSYLLYAASAAVTWDAFVGTWDGTSVTWDSRALQGGQPLLGMVDSSNVFRYFAGSNLAATFTTGVANSPVSGLITSATPIDDSPDGTLSLGVKDALDDSTTWKTGVAKTASGRTPLRGRGKNLAFKREITAASAWTYVKGVDHIVSASGGPR